MDVIALPLLGADSSVSVTAVTGCRVRRFRPTEGNPRTAEERPVRWVRLSGQPATVRPSVRTQRGSSVDLSGKVAIVTGKLPEMSA
jgi:hypothetical protein